MGGAWQISAGDLSETLRPALFALSLLASAWVLSDARRRCGFHLWAVWAWALCAFLFPPVVLPLYLVARMFTRRLDTPPAASDLEGDAGVASTEDSEGGETAAGSADLLPALSAWREPQGAPPLSLSEGETSEACEHALAGKMPALPLEGSRFAVPLLYAAALLLAGAVYFYQDYQSFDAHLARAARAKLYGRRERAIGEYRAALRTQDDAHTRKLLGLELLEAGRAEDALAELRAAAAGGEPDERLYLHIAALLESLNRPDEAVTSYERFLDSPLCLSSPGDANCMRARERLSALTPPAIH
ncbi:MAG: hypothetical protein LC802_16440 [Acidobacteria bacterium]|nr:hypothetical protein [Acidobacteriota bacterium]